MRCDGRALDSRRKLYFRILNSSIIADLVFFFSHIANGKDSNNRTRVSKANSFISNSSNDMTNSTHVDAHIFPGAESEIPFPRRRKQKRKKNYVGIRNKRAVVVDGDSGHAEMEWNIKWNKKKACTKCRCVAVLPVRAMINGKQTFISVAEMFAVKHHYCAWAIRASANVFCPVLSVAQGEFFFSLVSISCVICLNSSNEINDDLTPAIVDILL